MRTWKVLRPLANLGTEAWLRFLLLPPCSTWRQRFIIECFPASFNGADDYYSREYLDVGSVFDAYWEEDLRTGPDGKRLCVVLSDGPWHIDGRASNCTMPDDNEHHCWVRTGTVEEGTLCIHKKGRTCESGAGSIRTEGYHARLINNYLIEIPFF